MNRGFMIVGFIVVLFITLVSITLHFSQRFGESQILRRRIGYKASVENLMQSIEVSLKSQKGWVNTVTSQLNKNGGDLASCLSEIAYDCPKGSHPFSVIDALGAVLVDSSAPGNGFDINFDPCGAYSPSGATGCYLRYDLTWTPQCPASGPCNIPSIQVHGQLIVNPGSSSEPSIRTTSYDLNFTLR